MYTVLQEKIVMESRLVVTWSQRPGKGLTVKANKGTFWVREIFCIFIVVLGYVTVFSCQNSAHLYF